MYTVILTDTLTGGEVPDFGRVGPTASLEFAIFEGQKLVDGAELAAYPHRAVIVVHRQGQTADLDDDNHRGYLRRGGRHVVQIPGAYKVETRGRHVYLDPSHWDGLVHLESPQQIDNLLTQLNEARLVAFGSRLIIERE